MKDLKKILINELIGQKNQLSEIMKLVSVEGSIKNISLPLSEIYHILHTIKGNIHPKTHHAFANLASDLNRVLKFYLKNKELVDEPFIQIFREVPQAIDDLISDLMAKDNIHSFDSLFRKLSNHIQLLEKDYKEFSTLEDSTVQFGTF